MNRLQMQYVFIMDKREEIKARILSKEDKLNADNLRDALPEDTFVEIPDDAIVYIPTSRLTKVALTNCLNFVLKDISENDIFETLMKVKSNFKDDKGNDIDHSNITSLDNAVWILTTLIHEINFQAADQKQTKIYNGQEVYDGLVETITDPLKGPDLEGPDWERVTFSSTEKEQKNKPNNDEIVIKPNVD